MQLLLDVTLMLLALVGHTALWVGVANGLRAKGWSYRLIHILTGCTYLVLMAIPVLFVWWYVRSGLPLSQGFSFGGGFSLPVGYMVFLWVVDLYVVPNWAARTYFPRTISPGTGNHTTRHDIAKRLGRRPIVGLVPTLLTRIPGNQVFLLDVHRRELALDRLDPALSGLTIAHLSDPHLLGKTDRSYFEEVFGLVNELDADMVAITGDIIDRLGCLDWIPHTFGKLKSRHGVYFVLGNHERRLSDRDVDRVRREMTQAGLIDLGGVWTEIEVRGRRIVLAGNEMPWFPPAPRVPEPPDVPPGEKPLRILLSHTPDQIAWARASDFDLMLAGHTHGGQIRLPIVGPLICPSRHGVRYVGGSYYRRPTLLHVSCGISGATPIRLNCPPEVSELVLRPRRG